LESDCKYKQLKWDEKSIIIEDLKAKIKFPYKAENISIMEGGKEQSLKILNAQV
jgi:hypothetical protein